MLNLLLFGVILFLLLCLSMVWPPDSPWAPWWRTTSKIARSMCRLAKVTEGDVVYDMGSGDGTALMVATGEFGAKGVGIEIDPLRAYLSSGRIQVRQLQNRITIKRKNFFTVDISPATVVFVYLVPKALLRLKVKFLKELNPGTRVVSYRYPIPYLPLVKEDAIHQIYLYKIPQKKKH